MADYLWHMSACGLKDRKHLHFTTAFTYSHQWSICYQWNGYKCRSFAPRLYVAKITPETSITLGVPAFFTFPCKTCWTVYKRNKTLARRFDGKVTLLAGPTILHINTLTRPAEATHCVPALPPPPALYLKEAITVCVSSIVRGWGGATPLFGVDG